MPDKIIRNTTDENAADQSQSRSMTGFADICAQANLFNDLYRASIPHNWKQGRTTYGGLTLALSYAAAQKQLSALPECLELPALRSVHINFVGPVTRDPYFETHVLRQGRNVTSVQTTGFLEPDTQKASDAGSDTDTDTDTGSIAQGADMAATISSANFVFGASRSSALSVGLKGPSAPKPADCEPFTPEFARNFVPKFFHNFDTRLIAGARPVSGASEGYIRTWSRHIDPASRSGLASLLCIADVLPPAAMPMFRAMGPVSSVNFALNILVDNPQTEDGWWHIESRLTAALDGYSSQIMRIWSREGELVAEGTQCVAIFM